MNACYVLRKAATVAGPNVEVLGRDKFGLGVILLWFPTFHADTCRYRAEQGQDRYHTNPSCVVLQLNH